MLSCKSMEQQSAQISSCRSWRLLILMLWRKLMLRLILSDVNPSVLMSRYPSSFQRAVEVKARALRMASELGHNSSAVGANLPPSPAANQTRSPQRNSGIQRNYSSLARTRSWSGGCMSGGLQRNSLRFIDIEMTRHTVRKRFDQVKEYTKIQSAAGVQNQGHGNWIKYFPFDLWRFKVG